MRFVLRWKNGKLAKMSLDQSLKRIDARYRIPRPTDALHLDSSQASARLMRDSPAPSHLLQPANPLAGH
jgi:hypothetical protein